MISLILGLGNVGNEYAGTRHNLGFEVLNRVAEALRAAPSTTNENYRIAQACLPERSIALAWPTTLVNRSGLAAGDLLARLQLRPEQMLVVVDDFNLPLGGLRFRARGSDGGHRGLASIIEHLTTDEFPRLRLGIGEPGDKDRVREYVLGPFEKNEVEQVKRMLAIAAQAVIFALDHRLEEAMSKYNSNPALPEES